MTTTRSCSVAVEQAETEVEDAKPWALDTHICAAHVSSVGQTPELCAAKAHVPKSTTVSSAHDPQCWHSAMRLKAGFIVIGQPSATKLSTQDWQSALQEAGQEVTVVVPAASTKPDVHGVQVRSAVALPAVKASPAGQRRLATSIASARVAVQDVHDVWAAGQLAAQDVHDVWAVAVPAAST